MSLYWIVFTVFIIYTASYILDALFRAFGFFPYAVFLQRSGVKLGILQVCFEFTCFNKLFSRIGTWRPKLLRLWFTIGAYVSSILVLPSMVFLVHNLISSIWPRNEFIGTSDHVVTLQPVFPGVNLPLNDLGYYLLTLLTCSVIHELGHAVSAVSEDVRVISFGMNILFLLPAAFVNLPTDQLLSISSFRQLRVFSAGIWHNVMLALMAFLVLFSCQTLSTPFYTIGEGVAITHVNHGSVVQGPTGLQSGDVVMAINDCGLVDKDTWRDCLVKSINSPILSFCIEKEHVQQLDRTNQGNSSLTDEDCCGSDGQHTKDSLCFKETFKSSDTSDLKTRRVACLPVRMALEKSESNCDEGKGFVCPEEQICIRPSIQDNSTKLLKIKRSNDKDFLFFGSPAEVYLNVQISRYIPKISHLLFIFSPLGWPDRIELLCYYIVSFSGALAILNVVPCFMLDGQHMIRVLVDIIFASCSRHTRSIVTLTFTIVGTVLLAANTIWGMWQLV